MDKYEPSEFLKQAINKVQEAYEALEILEEHDNSARHYGLDGCASYFVQRALKILNKIIEERQEAVHKAQIEEIQSRRLCEKLGISYPERA